MRLFTFVTNDLAKTEISPSECRKTFVDTKPDMPTEEKAGEHMQEIVKDEMATSAIDPTLEAEKNSSFKKERGQVLKVTNQLKDEPEYFCDKCAFGSKWLAGLMRHRKESFVACLFCP